MADAESLADQEEVTQSSPDEPEAGRERSTIGFPYGDLDDAVAVAKAVHTIGGSSCEWDQLAAQLGQAANGGGFRQRLLTAKTFGLLTYSQGRVSLTLLGSSVCDSKQEKTARVDAFLKVELYKAVYDRFKGGVLPPPKGLEAEMASLGVASKQTNKARQVFQRAATQAGFFWSGQDRLVAPAKGNGAAPPLREKAEEDNKGQQRSKDGGGGPGDGGGGFHPLIEGLIKSLPKEGEEWPIEKRAKWLRAASQNFDLIYPDTGDDSIEIKIQRGNSQ